MTTNPTKQQLAFIRYCNNLGLQYEFTSETLASNWWRMAGTWKIGEIEYRLIGNEWRPRTDRAEVIRT